MENLDMSALHLYGFCSFLFLFFWEFWPMFPCHVHRFHGQFSLCVLQPDPVVMPGTSLDKRKRVLLRSLRNLRYLGDQNSWVLEQSLRHWEEIMVWDLQGNHKCVVGTCRYAFRFLTSSMCSNVSHASAHQVVNWTPLECFVCLNGFNGFWLIIVSMFGGSSVACLFEDLWNSCAAQLIDLIIERAHKQINSAPHNEVILCHAALLLCHKWLVSSCSCFSWCVLFWVCKTICIWSSTAEAAIIRPMRWGVTHFEASTDQMISDLLSCSATLERSIWNSPCKDF